MNVLMEGIPRGFDYSQVENTFVQIDGVVKVHNLRIWALSLDKTALSAHLAISKSIFLIILIMLIEFLRYAIVNHIACSFGLVRILISYVRF